MSEKNHFTIEIPIKDGESFGAMLDKNFVIVRIQPMTLADGKLEINDKILTINKIQPRSPNHFYQLVRLSPSFVRLEIIRENTGVDSCNNTILKKNLMSVNREKFFDERLEYVYTLVRIDIVKNKRLGLGICDFSNCVIVSKIDPGSLAEEKLEIRDHIVDVEGTRVTNKDFARELLIIAMRTKGYFTCLIERPVSENAKKLIDINLSIRTNLSSMKLSDDVCKIAQQQRKREIELTKAILTGQAPIRPSVLSGTTPIPKERPRVYFKDEENKCFTIGNDNKGKRLRPVRK